MLPYARSSFFFQAEDGIRDYKVTGVQTCALPICVDVARRRLGRPLRLEIVGEGFERPLIESIIDELDAGGWVTLRGSVSEPEKIDLYRRAGIIASASAPEGWGLAPTQAAARGTPPGAPPVVGP